jgi:hypothetical protein
MVEQLGAVDQDAHPVAAGCGLICDVAENRCFPATGSKYVKH